MQILSPGALWGPSLLLSPWLALKSALYPDPGAEGLLPPLPPMVFSGFTSFQPLHSVVSRLPPSHVLWRSSWTLSAAEAAATVSSDTRFTLLSSLALSGACPKSYGVCVSLGTLLAPASSDLQVTKFPWCLSPPTLPPAAWPLLAPLVEFPFQRFASRVPI